MVTIPGGPGSGALAGQPVGASPKMPGHWSAPSMTVSPSESGTQPVGAGPAAAGHLSTLSATPSPSPSGPVPSKKSGTSSASRTFPAGSEIVSVMHEYERLRSAQPYAPNSIDRPSR